MNTYVHAYMNQLEAQSLKPKCPRKIVISSQHSADVDQAKVRELLTPYMLKSIPEKFLEDFDEKEFYVNPTGNFVIGGSDRDCGLTGRKIIVDTYGGAAPHGGGAFSGKDPTKVDRSAAYASRYIAKNIVASKISDKCLIQLAYAIGVSKPLSIYVDLFDDDVEKNKLLPGDLLFFGSTNTRITHVGLFLGDGKFIHASVSQGGPKIFISDLNTYDKKFISARRLK